MVVILSQMRRNQTGEKGGKTGRYSPHGTRGDEMLTVPARAEQQMGEDAPDQAPERRADAEQGDAAGGD